MTSPDAMRFRKVDVSLTSSELQAMHDARELAEIQRLLLPRSLPQLAGWSMAAHYEPCHTAGGDFYGMQRLPSGGFGFVVADVSGHGVRAAVIMAMVRAWLGATRYFNRPGVDVALDLNAMLLEVGAAPIFVTAFFVDLDTTTGRFRYLNCGHPHARVRRIDGSIVPLIGAHCLPLGVQEDLAPSDVDDGEAVLEPGDAIVLYTDGISEARSPDGEEFGEEGIDLVLRAGGSGTMPHAPHALLDAIVAATTHHRGGRPQTDDECVLVLGRDRA
jgi:sigma-B regulation protein RsbU (phosphoserine phosphatase)